jgi:hypothetical protein
MSELTRLRKRIVCAVFFSAIAFVGYLLHSYNTVPSGYVAVYPVMGMWVLTLLVTVVAGILVAIPRTRFAGFVFAAAIVFIPSSFFLGVKLSEMAGFNRWRNAPMQRFGPDVPYSLVVYYQLGASDRQTFFESVVMRLIMSAEIHPEMKATPQSPCGPQRWRSSAPRKGPSENAMLNDIV